MSNKEALEYLEQKKADFKAAYENKEHTVIISETGEVLEVLEAMGKIPKKYSDWKNFNYLTHSLGNSKIGPDTLCISINTGLLCVMGVTSNCSNCKICYAVNQNRTYLKNTVFKNTKNQNTISKVVTGEIDLHTVLFETVYSIFCSYSENQIKNLKFLRISVEGDILDQSVLEVMDKIAGVLISVFSLVSAYSYTHNKGLDLSTVKNIVFNTSDFKNTDSHKTCETVFKLTADILEAVKNETVILCNGDCNNCSYCKNKKDTRTVLFLAHGGQFKGISEYNYLVSYLEAVKEVDYNIFLVETYLNQAVTPVTA